MPLLNSVRQTFSKRRQYNLLFDVTREFLATARRAKSVSVDLETSGLDWKTARIGSCQVYVEGRNPEIIRSDSGTCPPNLMALLADGHVRKIFHHAMFDLRFLAFQWDVKATNLACTKIASKILDPENGLDHSLKTLLGQRLNVRLEKDLQTSNWLARKLSHSQAQYAVRDVLYLQPLLSNLELELAEKDLLHLAEQCFKHLPTRVQLDLAGYRDVYLY